MRVRKTCIPKEACDQAKDDLRTVGIKFVQEKPVRVHPMKEYRRVPLSMLRTAAEGG